MNIFSKKYLKSLTTISGILIFLSIIAFAFIFQESYLHIIPISFLFVILTSIFFHIRVKKGIKKSQAKFNAAFLGATAIKLLLNLAFIIVYLILYRENLIVFISYFMILYFVFLFFDVKTILDEIKYQKKTKK